MPSLPMNAELVLEVADELVPRRVGRGATLRARAPGSADRCCGRSTSTRYLPSSVGVTPEIPIGMIGPAVDQLVVGLLRAQLVEVDHLVERRRPDTARPSAARDSGCSRSRCRPCSSRCCRSATHFSWSSSSLARVDVDHVDLLPVAAGFRAGVGQQLAVVARRCMPTARSCRPSTTCSDRSARGLRRCTNRPRTARPGSAGRRS